MSVATIYMISSTFQSLTSVIDQNDKYLGTSKYTCMIFNVKYTNLKFSENISRRFKNKKL